jgi:hypothetical protein
MRLDRQELACVVDQRVVDGNNAPGCIAHRGIALLPDQAVLVKQPRVSGHLSDTVVEAGWIHSDRELGIDAQDRVVEVMVEDARASG